MKGIIFNVLEEVVIANYGEAVWDDLLDAAGSNGVYTSLGSYADDQMMRLVKAASDALDISTTDVVRWFGRQAMPRFAERYPEFFTAYTSTRPFVLALNTIIHPEVRRLYTGALCPEFDFLDADNGALLIGYQSPRQLCALAHGFIEGAADHYHENVEVEHLQCMNRGDERCLMRMTVR
ncbi:MAG TPA: heme NO-binding domain-containing protein [Rhodanobacteraceae bacterium]|nr:heme NO-binding domain-containing protein [Rhodanobacteraceae bacterium]